MGQQPRPKQFFIRHPNLIFWVSFCVLNSLLFWPLYLLNRQGTGFWPFETLPVTVNDWPDFLRQLFLWRTNMDIFWLNAEIVLLLLLWVQARRLRGRWFRRLFAYARLRSDFSF